MGEIVKLMPRRKRIALIAHDNCKTENGSSISVQ